MDILKIAYGKNCVLYNTITMRFPFKATSSKHANNAWPAWADWLILALVCGLLFFFRLGNYPLFDLDEPRYAEAGREMLENGNWITPYFNYELRFDKPVFFYWLVALAYQWFGITEFAARFFSAVSGTLIVFSVYTFGRYWQGRMFGLTSALILATSALFIGIARMSITDMTLCLFMTGTTLCLFQVAHASKKWWIPTGILAGLGILTKGPVALIVPGAILTLYSLIIRQWKQCFLNRWFIGGLLASLAISVPWYIAAYQQNKDAFLEAQFLHNVKRYSDVVSGHKQPPYFYTLVLVAGFLPWTLYLPAALKQWWQRFHSGHDQLIQKKDFSYLLPLYALVWTGFVFIFFSLGSTKLLTYILPLFPALALLCGSAWSNFQQQGEDSSEVTTLSPAWFSRPAFLWLLGTFIASWFFINRMGHLLPREAAGVQANQYNQLVAVILIAGSALATWLIHKQAASKALAAIIATTLVAFIPGVIGILPNVSQAAQGPMLRFIKQAHGQPLMLYETQAPSLTFYTRQRVPRYVEEQKPDIIKELQPHTQTYVITKSNYVSQLKELLAPQFEVNLVEKDSVYSLLSVRKAT